MNRSVPPTKGSAVLLGGGVCGTTQACPALAFLSPQMGHLQLDRLFSNLDFVSNEN